MKKKIQVILFVVIFFGGIYMFFPSAEESHCNLQKEFKETKINGFVTNKYIDSSQHSYPIIEVFNEKTKKVSKINLVLENNGLFDEIDKNDFLDKSKGIDDLSIFKKNNSKIVIKANFGCEIKVMKRLDNNTN